MITDGKEVAGFIYHDGKWITPAMYAKINKNRVKSIIEAMRPLVDEYDRLWRNINKELNSYDKKEV